MGIIVTTQAPMITPARLTRACDQTTIPGQTRRGGLIRKFTFMEQEQGIQGPGHYLLKGTTSYAPDLPSRIRYNHMTD